MGIRGKIDAIWWNIKINLQNIFEDLCGYELPRNSQNFTLAKILLTVLGGYVFLKHPVYYLLILIPTNAVNAPKENSYVVNSDIC